MSRLSRSGASQQFTQRGKFFRRSALLGATLLCLMTGAPVVAADTPPLVTPLADLVFVPLDPQDSSGKGPAIHVLFGELNKKGPLAFLARLPAGYSAGWHTHSRDAADLRGHRAP